MSALKSGGECCMIASEENEGLIYIDSEISSEAKYIVAIDPLDGSSNIDVNVSVGTILSVYRRRSMDVPVGLDDGLQRGIRQVADRKSVVEGKSGEGSVELGGGLRLKK